MRGLTYFNFISLMDNHRRELFSYENIRAVFVYTPALTGSAAGVENSMMEWTAQ